MQQVLIFNNIESRIESWYSPCARLVDNLQKCSGITWIENKRSNQWKLQIEWC